MSYLFYVWYFSSRSYLVIIIVSMSVYYVHVFFCTFKSLDVFITVFKSLSADFPICVISGSLSMD